MTRARCVLGSASMRARFDEIRRSVICAQRDAAGLRAEIVAMRNKVRLAHGVPTGKFDVKHSVGGMVDAEFAMQFLILSEADRHPELVANLGNIALLQCAERCGLLRPGLGEAAASAYRELRRVQHHARLNEEPTQVDATHLLAQREAVAALWRCTLEGPSKAA